MFFIWYQIAGFILFFLASFAGRLIIGRINSYSWVIRSVQMVFHLFYQLPFVLYVLARFFKGKEILNWGIIFKLPVFLLILAFSFFVLASVLLLWAFVDIFFQGKGGPSLVFTKRLIEKSIYHYIRNPMSLGWYLFVLSFAFYFNSLYLLVVCLLGYIPVHIFYLKFFEERELELRFGRDYLSYKKEVPFLFPRIFRERGEEYARDN